MLCSFLNCGVRRYGIRVESRTILMMVESEFEQRACERHGMFGLPETENANADVITVFNVHY